MKSLHDFISRTVPAYYRWHKHPLAGTAHWALFVAIGCALTANLLFAVNSYAQTVDGTTAEESTISTEQVVNTDISANAENVTTESAEVSTTNPVSTTTATQIDQTEATTTDVVASVVVSDATSTDIIATTTETNASSTETSAPSPIVGGITSEHAAPSNVGTTDNIVTTPGAASTTETKDKTIAKIDDVVPKLLPKIISLNDGLIVPSGSRETDYISYPIFVITKENIEINSSPAGIACGTTCSHKFIFGTKVVLTATQDDAQSTLVWKGCESVSGKSCTVTASNTRIVTVTTR